MTRGQNFPFLLLFGFGLLECMCEGLSACIVWYSFCTRSIQLHCLEVSLPVRSRHIRGRDEGDELTLTELGPPDYDVILYPGDVLYVPRGCIHATSTPPGTGPPSMHLTVGIEAMWDQGLSSTWESLLGAGELYRHSFIQEGYFQALRQLTDTDSTFRQTPPRPARRPGSVGPKFKEAMRSKLHQIVDQIIDGTDTLSLIQKAKKVTMEPYLNNLKTYCNASQEKTLPHTNVATHEATVSSWFSAFMARSTSSSSNSGSTDDQDGFEGVDSVGEGGIGHEPLPGSEPLEVKATDEYLMHDEF
eukprot:m.89403 g.89403  ORF g.89403 m.89403 type:complete len:302 (+) comp12893_c0_seq4:1442-2347(+)